jgi:hypothetical protein
MEVSNVMAQSDSLVVSTDPTTGRSILKDKRSAVDWDLGVVKDLRPADDGRSVTIHCTLGPGEKSLLLKLTDFFEVFEEFY